MEKNIWRLKTLMEKKTRWGLKTLMETTHVATENASHKQRPGSGRIWTTVYTCERCFSEMTLTTLPSCKTESSPLMWSGLPSLKPSESASACKLSAANQSINSSINQSKKCVHHKYPYENIFQGALTKKYSFKLGRKWSGEQMSFESLLKK